MKFSNVTKELMLTTISGLFTASSGILGSTTGIHYYVFSGSVPTDEELLSFYNTHATLESSVHGITALETKLIALGKTKLGSVFIKPVSIEYAGKMGRTFKLSGKELVVSASGEATFVVISMTENGTRSNTFFVFDLDMIEPELELRDRNLVAGQTLYLNDVYIKFSLGESI